MARNEFENEVRDLLKSVLPVSHRIQDAAFNRTLGRQVTKKPFDFFGCTEQGVMVAVEAKRVKVNRFSFSALSEHQHDELVNVALNRGFSLLAINFRVKAPDSRCGRAFFLPILAYLKIKDICLATGRKSITPDHIPEKYEMRRVTGGWEIQDRSIFE